MDEPQFKFMTFRNLEEPPKDIDLSMPPFQFAALLESKSLSFQLITTRLEREQAFDDPDAASLYPEGPLSGPPFVVIYEFITTRPNLDLARTLAAEFRPTSGSEK